ncbi:hypothetical protein QL285_084169 [Trifolium repens]|nr:hypothetical protein QL285_084169 [Trifolium repens]
MAIRFNHLLFTIAIMFIFSGMVTGFGIGIIGPPPGLVQCFRLKSCLISESECHKLCIAKGFPSDGCVREPLVPTCCCTSY